ncbi:hypothetical protein Taro_041347, partial [Colocasia esculenta]|nr:hypothetical protein [Colocasia esculenta]
MRKWDKNIVREYLYFNGAIKDKRFWDFRGPNSSCSRLTSLDSACEDVPKDGGMHSMLRDILPIKRHDVYATKNKTVIANAMSSIDISVLSINELEQPVGEGGHSLKLFLGTIARLSDKIPIDAPTWRAMSATHKNDVWEYVQKKYDIPAYLKKWVMKNLDQKWRSWKCELRNKYFNPTLKQNEQQIPPDLRVNVEQWKRVVQTRSSNSWKRYSDINKKSKSHHKYFHYAGTKSFADINEEE